MKNTKRYKPKSAQRRNSHVRLSKRIGQATRMPGDQRPRVERSWSDFFSKN